jgi:hypothetical protein
MIINDVSIEGLGQDFRLSTVVVPDGSGPAGQLYFRVSGAESELVTRAANAVVPALVLPAMALGEELRIEGPVSPRLLRGARTAMRLYRTWWSLSPVPITPASVLPGARRGCGTGLFFTAGVDSWYSLLKDITEAGLPGHESITHLIFVNFEQARDRPYERLLERLCTVARETGKHLLVIETNVRRLTERTVGWNEYHGAALASVALALDGILGRCLIASTEDYEHLPPWGSHPLLDPLWSTEGLELIHDGCEVSRVEKACSVVARSPLAMQTLSVCWRTLPDHNCGACDKCLGTMIALELAGALERCCTLPSVLDLDQVRAQRLWGWAQCDSWRELADHSERYGRQDITDSIDYALARAQESNGWKPVFWRPEHYRPGRRSGRR